MALYLYKAIDAGGMHRSGELEAGTRAAALETLHKRGLLPVDVATRTLEAQREVAPGPIRRALQALRSRTRVTAADLASVTYSLASLLKAGLTVDRALSIAASLERRPGCRALLQQLHNSVRSGTTFTEALTSAHVKLPVYYASMVQAGELGGTLPETLARVAGLLRKQSEIREQIRSALTYPAMLAGVVIVTLGVLLGFVLPRFRSLFADSEAPLPWSTQAVLAMGEFTSNYWWLMTIALVAATFALRSYFKSPAGRSRLHRWFLMSRLLAGLPADMDSARMLRTLSTLLQNGVTLPAALGISKGTLANLHLRHGLDRVMQQVKAGEVFTRALAAVAIFPSQAVQLARVGEETGRLDELLAEAATVLETESERRLARLLTLLVPVLTIGMGLLIAGLIGSVLIGLLSINDLAF